MSADIILSFLTLSMLEIVLGIDNLIFIALVANTLPKEYRAKARLFGLTLALIIRVGMLMSISWIMQLTEPLFTLLQQDFSVRDLLLAGGGIFLLVKGTMEIHADLGGEHEKKAMVAKKPSFRGAIIQIVIIDLVFSFDSIITAVGMASNLYVMIAAVIVSMIVMLLASDWISKFLHDYPAFKILALSFILMIGMALVAEGLHFHVPKAYIYCSFAFSIFVEILNTLASKRRRKLKK